MSLSSLAVWFLWAALCYVAVGLAGLSVQASRCRNENPEFSEIKIWLWCLLRNGFDGENVLFHDDRKRRFIRFEKYTDDDGISGIELTFPEIGWGEELLPRLRTHAEHKGLTFRAFAIGHGASGNDLHKDIPWTSFPNEKLARANYASHHSDSVTNGVHQSNEFITVCRFIG